MAIQSGHVDGAMPFQHEISDQLQGVTKSFTILLGLEELKRPQFEALVKHTLWQDELGRLRIWAANIGAHQRGDTSLDFRLRDASHIRHQIVDILKSLNELLEAAIDLIRPEQSVSPIETDVGDDLFDNETETEYEEIHGGVSSRIDCLLEMSLAVRKPAKLDRIVGLKKAQWGPYSQFDMEHIRMKFPGITQDLLMDLASATTFRRGVLRYYESHSQKYAREAKEFFDEGEEVEKHRIPLGPDASTAPATEYAPGESDTHSVYSDSNRSMASLIATANPLHVPIPSRVYDQKPFECPYCHYLLAKYNAAAYVRHVFEDITPYQCLFSGCDQSRHLLASRTAWLRHLQSVHEQWWRKCSSSSCFMCGQSEYSEDSFDKHIARHLEDLAIFTLPLTNVEEDIGQEAEIKGEVDEALTSQLKTEGSSRSMRLINEAMDPDWDIWTEYEQLDQLNASYVLRSFQEASEFFVKGRVFAMVWHENAGKASTSSASVATSVLDRPFHRHTITQDGITIFARIRRFVVVKAQKGSYWAVPILSYDGRGLSGKNMSSEEIQAHTIIYAAGSKPEYLQGEPRLVKKPIAVVMKGRQQLTAASRLNFSRPQSIEWNVKTRDVGQVVGPDLRRLLTYFTEEFLGGKDDANLDEESGKKSDLIQR